MADSVEELDPLFDYRRVQPLNIISLDDDDDSPIVPAKRRKISNSGDVKDDSKKVEVFVIDCEEVDDKEEDDDWLLPPPSTGSEDVTNCEEDSTIGELRRKKEELASFAKSTEDVLLALEELAKKEHDASLQPSPEKGDEQLPTAASERAKIVISIQDKDGRKQFRILADDKFERLFKMYADRIKLGLDKLVFTFDGEKISPTSTPISLEMEDDDIIEVHVKSS